MLCSALPLTILLRLDPFEMQRSHFNNTTDTPAAQTLTTKNYYTKTRTHRSLYTQHRSSTDHLLNHPLTLDRQHHNHMQPISRSTSQCKTLHINQNPGPKDHKPSLKNFPSPNRYTQNNQFPYSKSARNGPYNSIIPMTFLTVLACWNGIATASVVRHLILPSA